MRIGFFGGTFDPPHRGHLALAQLALDRLHLDRILVAPVGAQPLKRDLTPASFDDRVAMTRLALDSHPHFELSLLDAPRPDGKPNYTIDTIETLRHQLRSSGGEDPTLLCIAGADVFLTVKQWHRAADLLLTCPFAIGARPGFDLTRLAHALPEGVAIVGEDQPGPACRIVAIADPAGRRSQLYLLPQLQEDVSATEIRAALRAGGNEDALLAPAVAAYIQQHDLYRS